MNKIMFIVGLIMALTAAALMFFREELGSSPIVLGIIGIIFIAVSRKQKKK